MGFWLGWVFGGLRGRAGRYLRGSSAEDYFQVIRREPDVRHGDDPLGIRLRVLAESLVRRAVLTRNSLFWMTTQSSADLSRPSRNAADSHSFVKRIK